MKTDRQTESKKRWMNNKSWISMTSLVAGHSFYGDAGLFFLNPATLNAMMPAFLALFGILILFQVWLMTLLWIFFPYFFRSFVIFQSFSVIFRCVFYHFKGYSAIFRFQIWLKTLLDVLNLRNNHLQILYYLNNRYS